MRRASELSLSGGRRRACETTEARNVSLAGLSHTPPDGSTEQLAGYALLSQCSAVLTGAQLEGLSSRWIQ